MLNILFYIPVPEEPVVGAEMGSFEMAKAMKNDNVYLFISKRYSLAEWTKFTEENQNLMDRIVHASCRGEEDAGALDFILENITEIRRIYLTSKNQLSENFQVFVKSVKRKYPSYAVMVGDVEERKRRIPLENVWLWSFLLGYIYLQFLNY